MPKFLSLPNEAIQHVLSFLYGDSVEAISICSKRLHALSKDIRDKHNTLVKKHRKVTCGKVAHTFGESTTELHPSHLLREVLQDQVKAEYIRFLVVDDCTADDLNNPHGQLPRDHRAYSEQVRALLSDVSSHLKSRIRVCPFIRAYPHPHVWEHQIMSGHKGETLMFLLYLLPNLQSLNIVQPPGGYNSDSVVPALAEPIYRLARKNQIVPRQGNALGQLHSVAVYEDISTVEGAGNSLQHVAILAGIPSARRLSFQYASGDSMEWPYRKFASRLTTLSLTYCAATTQSLDRLLLKTPLLQNFHYTPIDPSEYDKINVLDPDIRVNTCWQSEVIVSVLIKHFKRHLLILNITGPSGNVGGHTETELETKGAGDSPNFRGLSDNFIGSLQIFEKLHTIRLGNGMFVKDHARLPSSSNPPLPRRKMQPLVNMLPKSTKRVTFANGFRSLEAASMFEGFQNQSKINYQV